MDHTADVLHLSMSVWPEWDPNVPVHWSNIHVNTVASHQFSQLPGWQGIADKIAGIMRWELALTYVMQFQEKLNQITPWSGYMVDAVTRAVMVGNITIVTALSEAMASQAPSYLPLHPINSFPPTRSVPSTLQRPSLSVESSTPKAVYV